MFDGIDADLLLVFSETLKADNACQLRIERIIIADADIVAGMKYGAALTDEDAASTDALAIRTLNAEPLRMAVTAVARRTHSFFMGKKLKIHHDVCLRSM